MRVCPTCYAQEQETARFCGLCGTPLLEIKSSADQMVGQVVGGKFSIERLIGRGGMGDVYLAFDRVLDRKVAIKILNHRFRGDETVIMRFHKEAKSYARVNHANAVVLFDYGQLDDGNVYLVMEYVDGCNLSEFLRRYGGPLPQDVTLQLAIQLAEALTAAHAQGVVHRDLKPDNIMLVEPTKGRLQIKVLDFGIAKLLDDNPSPHEKQLTQAGMVFGTPEFMSPEQAQGIEVDHRTDIYAFGMILYFMLTHRLPFEGKNKIAILNQQVNDPPTPPSTLAPDAEIHPNFESLLMNCIEKERDDRYPSFDAVLSDLGRLALGEPLTFGSEYRQGPRDDLPAPDFVDLDDAPPPVRPPPAMPRSGPRPEVSSLIAIGNIPRSEMSGIISLGNMNAVAGSQRPSGPRHLGPTPTPKPTPNPTPADANWQIDTQSPSWFDRHADPEPTADPLTAPTPSEPDLLSNQTTNVDLRKSAPTPASSSSYSIGGDDDDDDGFTLSDDIGGPHTTGSYKSNRDGGHVGLIIFLVLIIGGAAAAYWLWWLPSQQAAKNQPPPTTSQTSGTTPSNTTNPQTTPDAVSAEADVTSPTSQTSPTVQTPAKPPPPLPDAFSNVVRQRAIARAILNHAQALFDDTKFKEAQAFLSSEHLSLPSVVGPLQDLAITRLATTQRAQELVGSATADLQNLRCDRAELSLTELASISSPAASQLQPKIKTCKRKLEAPPTKIPD